MNFKTLLGAVAGIALAMPAAAQSTLKIVMHSDLKILDPVWASAQISRTHGYLVYDTLFGLCLLYTSPSPRDKRQSRMPSSA